MKSPHNLEESPRLTGKQLTDLVNELTVENATLLRQVLDEKFPPKVEDIDNEISDVEYLQYIPASQSRIKEYFMSMTEAERSAVKKVIKYTSEGIDVYTQQGYLIAKLEYEDVKIDQAILGQGVEKIGADGGNYISYNIGDLPKQYSEGADRMCYDPVIEEQDGVVYGSYEGWLRYAAAANITLPDFIVRRAMVKQMPAGDCVFGAGIDGSSQTTDTCIAVGQLHRLLGGQLSGMRHGGMRNYFSSYGRWWSRSRDAYSIHSLVLRSSCTMQSRMQFDTRSNLFPARALRTHDATQ